MSDVERVDHPERCADRARAGRQERVAPRAHDQRPRIGESTITGLSPGKDVAATSVIMDSLVRRVMTTTGSCTSKDPRRGCMPRRRDLDCGNSGTTMRLMSGVVSSIPGVHELVGDASLSPRPMDRIATPLGTDGRRVDGDGHAVTPRSTSESRAPASDRLSRAGRERASEVGDSLAGLFADGPTHVREDVRTRRTTEDMLRRRDHCRQSSTSATVAR